MHGRVKVRTTAEERERQKKEQQLKVRAYRAAMSKIQNKRAAGELDNEMLLLTLQVLQRNPDVSTLWNIRRECVLAKSARLQQPPAEPVEQNEEAAKSVEQELQALYANELAVTEQCLKINPKSYNNWHHRCWTLEQNPQADWQHELQLCNKYLKYDERNFHTWDYRRYVAAKLQLPEQQELDFCTDKIKVNFSNYSSWHHRSLLLPVLHPYEGSARPKRPMSEQQLKQELEMVLTAAFTDPNDSSAWFYQRWLLGGSAAAQQEQPSVVAFRCSAQRAVLGFSKSKAHFTQSVRLNADAKSWELQQWQPVDVFKTIWQCSLPDAVAFDSPADYSLQLDDQTLQLKPLSHAAGLFYFEAPLEANSYSAEVLEELQTQLQSCLELLEYEPDSKWTLLTSALLLRAIDARQNHGQSLQHLDKLQTVDALRAGYYKDLAARWSMELALTQWPQSAQFPTRLDLTGQPAAQAVVLKWLPYAQYLVVADELDLPEHCKSNLLPYFKHL